MREFFAYVRNKKVVVIAVLMTILLAYGFEISNWTMTIDEEIHAHREKLQFAIQWIGDGRWGITILKTILPTHFVLPFFNGIMAVVTLGLSALLIAYIFYNYGYSVYSQFSAAILFISCPIFSYYLMFDTFSVELSIGILFAIISAFCTSQYSCISGKKRFAFSIVFLTWSIAIYQTLLFVYIAMICGILLLNVFGEEKLLTAKMYAVCIVNSVLILLISLIIYKSVSVVLEKYVYDFDYVDGYWRWSYWDFNQCLFEIKNCLKVHFLTPGNFYYGGWMLSIVFIIYIISLLIGIITCKRRVILVLAWIGLLFSIAGQNIVMGGPMPIRSFQSIAVFIAFMIVPVDKIGAMLHKASFRKILDIEVGTTIFVILFCLYQSAMINNLFYSEQLRQKSDEATLNRILVDVEDLNVDMTTTPLVFVGSKPWESNYKINTEQFELSMFATGQISRIYSWMLDLGYTYVTPKAEQQEKAEHIAEDMSEWPTLGSVKYEDGMVIVNLGGE